MRTFCVKNFERFQHYKDRSPPWIKLYNELLDDYEFGRLRDASKMHLVAIWLLASRSDNKLPYDPAWIARRINATDKVDLDALVNAGFIVADQPLRTAEQDASVPLAKCLPRDREETEGETEGETEESRVLSHPSGGQDLFEAHELWNEAAESLSLSKAQVLNVTRKAHLRHRLTELGGIEGWRAMLEIIGKSPHLLGDNDRGWKITFDWILKPANLTKVMEGNYVRAKTNRPNSIAAGFDDIRAALESGSEQGDQCGAEDPFGLPGLRQSAA